MKGKKRFTLIALLAGLGLAVVLLGRSLWLPAEPERAGRLPLAAGPNGPVAPAGSFQGYQPGRGQGQVARAAVVDARKLKPAPNDSGAPRTAEERIESKLTEAQYNTAKEYGKKIGPTSGVRAPDLVAAQANLLFGFSGPNATQCCAGTGYSVTVPPDPDVAVGPNHILAVVNDAYIVYNRTGTVLSGPISFPALWSANSSGSNCAGITQRDFFDPFVAYDVKADRWVLGIDGYHDVAPQVSRFCVAVSTTGDPTGTWYEYGIAANEGITGSWADFPHMTVWNDAIYLTNNYFTIANNSYTGARVYALNKAQAYAGGPVGYVYHDTPVGGDGTPWDTMQPAKPNWGGLAQTGPEYFLSAAFCANPNSCDNFGVFRWDDPFGANNLVLAGTPGVTAYVQQPDAAQPGVETIQTNDWRMLDAKWAPDGTLYGAHTIGCNPGSGTVSCIQWAQLTTSGILVQQGLIATNGIHRYFPSLAVDRAGNLHIGYTQSSSVEYASVVVAGRLKTDPAGVIGGESLAKPGELGYTSFSGDPSPHRWGDYTGLVIDPVGGCQAFYLGEYAANVAALSKWGTWVESAVFPNCTPANLFLPFISR